MKIDYTHYYKKWHPNTDQHRQFMLSYYQRILCGRLPESRDAAILEIGCGAGLAISALRSLGYKNVRGIDSDSGQVDLCRQNGFDVALVSDTVEFLRANKASYNVILAFDLIEHIPVSSQLEFVGAIHSALQTPGILICTVPNANSSLAARWRYIDWTHHCSFTEHSLDLLLHSAGFDRIEVLPAEFHKKPSCVLLPVGGARHWWALKFFRFWRRLEMMAELGPGEGRRVPLSLNLLGVAEKP